jgi:hypothetical protein
VPRAYTALVHAPRFSKGVAKRRADEASRFADAARV